MNKLTPNDNWLSFVDSQKIRSEAVPFQSILANSVFYPGSGLDARPIHWFSDKFPSFVYADYGLDASRVRRKLRELLPGFRVVGLRTLTTDDWAEGLGTAWEAPEVVSHRVRAPFAHWVVYENSPSDLEGVYFSPKRVSLLFVGLDGCDAFRKLYLHWAQAPAVLTMIQAPPGFGGNWTDFHDPQAELGRLVRENPAGLPDHLVMGGIEGHRLLRHPWPEFQEFVCALVDESADKGGSFVGLWRAGK